MGVPPNSRTLSDALQPGAEPPAMPGGRAERTLPILPAAVIDLPYAEAADNADDGDPRRHQARLVLAIACVAIGVTLIGVGLLADNGGPDESPVAAAGSSTSSTSATRRAASTSTSASLPTEVAGITVVNDTTTTSTDEPTTTTEPPTTTTPDEPPPP